MEAAAQGGGGGGPAPFLLKTYDMVDEATTDDIVSWSESGSSFIVWNHPELAARLLPTFFKHNNFSSFIRQLNTYGFRKVDPERWEFANADFARGHKHSLKNIHRRKPIHSHSQPPAGGLPDADRAALEDEIERLTRDKTALQADLLRFRQQQPALRDQLGDFDNRLRAMEFRQERMLAFFERALHSPAFLDNLVKMAGAGPIPVPVPGPLIDFSAIHKRRRLPTGGESCLEVAETSFFDNHSSTSKPEIGHIFQRDKLKLELSPAISDCHLTIQSSSGDDGSPQGGQGKQPDCSAHLRMECLSLVRDTMELSDTGASFCPRKSVLFPRMLDDGDGLIPCHLNLTLASTSMQIDTPNHCPSPDTSQDEGAGGEGELRSSSKDREDDPNGKGKDDNSSSQRDAAPNGNQAPAAPQGRVNDVFWEQFLTERPGSSDTEEASSSLGASPRDEQQEERKAGNETMWRNRKGMEQLTL